MRSDRGKKMNDVSNARRFDVPTGAATKIRELVERNQLHRKMTEQDVRDVLSVHFDPAVSTELDGTQGEKYLLHRHHINLIEQPFRVSCAVELISNLVFGTGNGLISFDWASSKSVSEINELGWLLDQVEKSVEEFIDRSEQHQRQLIEEWDATVWPQIAGKTEGVDFRYTK